MWSPSKRGRYHDHQLLHHHHHHHPDNRPPHLIHIFCLKSLNLTGNVWGDPVPEVSWRKNDKELVSDDHYKLTFEHGKFASITIAAVSEADSGKYALLVKNKYGTEAGTFTVSVYNPEEEESKEEKKGQ